MRRLILVALFVFLVSTMVGALTVDYVIYSNDPDSESVVRSFLLRELRSIPDVAVESGAPILVEIWVADVGVGVVLFANILRRTRDIGGSPVDALLAVEWVAREKDEMRNAVETLVAIIDSEDFEPLR